MVIIDTSIVFKWFDPSEKGQEVAKVLLNKHLARTENIIIPDLLLYEITNAWATKTHMDNNLIRENLSRLDTYVPNRVSVTIVFLSSSCLAKSFLKTI